MASKFRAATKKTLEPAMVREGFSVRYPYFQRKRGGRLDLVNLQHDKWGGGFFLEFATCESGDLETTWGETVPEARIDVAYTDPATRARLLATTSPVGSPEDYFRYEAFADDREKCDALVEQVVSLLPQVLEWLESGVAGRNVSPFSEP